MGHLNLDSPGRKRVKFCPCNKSNRDGKFVPYVDYDKFGYCHSCGTNFLPESGTIIRPIIHTEKQPTFYHESELVTKRGRNFKKNNFVKYLLTKFEKKEVEAAILKYLIGTSGFWQGATVFWQFDNQEKVRHGKIMLYNSETGRRSKEHFNTIKNVLKIPVNGHSLRQCLFGLHLINETNKKIIAVVESEKTAIVMSLIFNDFVWLATGGKGNFKYDLLKSIKSYKIVAFPDKDAISEWKETAEKLNKYGFKVQVDELLSGLDIPENADLADIFLKDSSYLEREKIAPILSNQDIIVNQLKNKNPLIQQLIDDFDLVHENGSEILITDVKQT